ncbi:hypothetical protein KGF56_000707 [Candida oxycetoniae]|uniref:J domain-containing protein n=1 Tax=Candida oxycetoniae TaxID=497107 RepID=A0AAI9T187_9ASCO|nr:uncharacterized protein KGF56_000707 [Candida oxycetoniae]KAI3406575.2 hypothetical protein KGF56_000707 [Candida oxycetoniae]
MFQPIRHLASSAAVPSSFSSSQTHYQLLGVPINASIKEIKLQFKKLSKEYHPDLNQHLDDEAKKANAIKFTAMANAYDVLKDVKRKREYDQSIHNSHRGFSFQRREENAEYNKYYGEAKYYSRSGSPMNASGLNTKRHKIRYHNTPHDTNHSKFSGRHINYGDKYDVPHFDYDKHLNRNLKFEQRIIEKHIDRNTRDRILSQLSKSGETVSEELKTKHLLRHVNMLKNESGGSNSSSSSSSGGGGNYSNVKYGASSTYQGASAYSNLYQKPTNHDNEGSMFKVFAALGASTSLYLLYKVIF